MKNLLRKRKKTEENIPPNIKIQQEIVKMIKIMMYGIIFLIILRETLKLLKV